ncbi:MAG: diguanylate cyclase [Devosia sp.]
MVEHWQQLIGNFAVVALFILAWAQGQFLVKRLRPAWRAPIFGAAMGLGAVLSMLLAVPIGGAIFDLRLVLVAIAGFFGGPLAGLVAAGLAIAYRLSVGGSAAIIGVTSIILTLLIGVGIARLVRGRQHPLFSALALAAGVSSVTLGISTTLSLLGSGEVGPLTFPIALLNGAATLVAAFFMLRHSAIERERYMLRAAFAQSPDVQHIKTPQSRFVAVNAVLAERSGFANPADLVGKTDFDILDASSAAGNMADDLKILRTGQPKIDFEERVLDALGDEIWYLSSKVPLRDIDGTIIGIAAWTRDITGRKRLEREVVESRNQLSYVLSELSDGIAMFDRQGTLAYRNERYASMFPRTGAIRRSGQHIRDILAAVVDSGEQVGVPTERAEEWIDKIVASLSVAGVEEVQFVDGGWLQIRTRPTSDGSSLLIVSDITKLKEAEQVMLAMTEQLKLLASTDGLTGLTNRRAFDQALETEMSRCRRSGEGLALLLVDVDRFKAYNDHYGHQAGDKVLKVVAQCLTQSLMRPADIAARYGGEEFVAILPGTNEDGAYFVADAFRETLSGMKMPHVGGDKGVVTASVGLAMFEPRDAGMNSTELIRRADQALYDAKAAGRDRVLGWSARHNIKSADGLRA